MNQLFTVPLWMIHSVIRANRRFLKFDIWSMVRYFTVLCATLWYFVLRFGTLCYISVLSDTLWYLMWLIQLHVLQQSLTAFSTLQNMYWALEMNLQCKQKALWDCDYKVCRTFLMGNHSVHIVSGYRFTKVVKHLRQTKNLRTNLKLEQNLNPT